MKTFLHFVRISGIASAAWLNAGAATPAPDFGPNVHIFDPSMTPAAIQQQCDSIYRTQERNQFGPNRYALLFKPGTYDLDVKVGYYTHVAGLGSLPGDVVIKGVGVHSDAGWSGGDALVNFWRACENLTIVPSKSGIVRWAVSQASPFRRMQVKGPIILADTGASSGGFMADSKIDDQVISASQQQWISRNSEWRLWNGGVWNMVFVGDVNPPAGTWPERPFTTVAKTPIVREKPFLQIDRAGNYSVFVPAIRTNSIGCSWKTGVPPGEAIPIDQFYIARADKDSAATINAALAQGKHLLLTPGVYPLKDAIRITRPGTIVLGIGLATLTPQNGTPGMLVSDVDGVKIAGILLDAGPKESPILLQVGEPGSAKNHAKDPIFLYDIFCRVGGAGPGSAVNSVTINSSYVIGDHFWIWRADHGAGAGWKSNPGQSGLIVNGQFVTIYGLFVEHYQEYQTVWNGDGGRVYMYQCEMPYDPPTPEEWQHDGVQGWAAYKVSDKVTTHEAWGVGIYCIFLKPRIVAANAVEAPKKPGVKFQNITTFRLGNPSGDTEIENVINGEGGPAHPQAKVMEDPG
jgi:hypothetical protein